MRGKRKQGRTQSKKWCTDKKKKNQGLYKYIREMYISHPDFIRQNTESSDIRPECYFSND